MLECIVKDIVLAMWWPYQRNGCIKLSIYRRDILRNIERRNVLERWSKTYDRKSLNMGIGCKYTVAIKITEFRT